MENIYFLDTDLHELTLFIRDLDSCLRRNDIRVEIAALGCASLAMTIRITYYIAVPATAK
jgi:hypothetical protein